MLTTVKKAIELEQKIESFKKKGLKIGFVPTMGALHEGHLSLIHKCKSENDICVVSIYVNPTQFNEKSDFDKYPRIEDRDIKILEQTACDLVFIPYHEEIYPGGHFEKIKIELGHLDQILEGAHRPGHFDGVVTIVKKLFEMVRPDRAYFGQKDYQQFMVIKKMVSNFSLDVEVIPCPIVREADGLAMSSRNMLLNAQERKQAAIIYQTLIKARELLGNEPVESIKLMAKSELSGKELTDFEYFEILDADHFLPCDKTDCNGSVVICTATRVGKVRLIDNIIVN